MDYEKLAKARQMKAHGTERIEDAGAAEEARADYRRTMAEPPDGVGPGHRSSANERVLRQAQADFKSSRDKVWAIAPSSPELEERRRRAMRRKTRRERS
jgi:hypothetical protein